MSIIRVQRITVHLDGQIDPLFREVSFEINPRDRIGLIGPNGCGKTTLLRVLTGEIRPQAGEVVRSCDTEEAGYLRQQTTSDNTWTVLQTAMAGRLAELHRVIRHLETQMGILTGQALDRAVRDYSRALDAYHDTGGYEREREAAEALRGLGFEEEQLSLPVTQLSSGQRTRVELSRLLIQPTDLLLLDEPTNHLDTEGQDWLEAYLLRFDGAALIVSHDRYFLDRTVIRILELRRGVLREFAGNFTQYTVQRRQEEEEAWEQHERAGKEAKRLRASVGERQRTARKVQGKPAGQTYDPYHRSFYKSKAAKVQKRAKVIEQRMEQQVERQKEIKPFVEKRTVLSFSSVMESGPIVLEAVGVSKSYGDKVLFEEAGFSIARGRRVAVVGRNGSGKTTLLRILLEQIAPDRGEIRVGGRVKIGYYAQEREGLNPDRTILEEALSVGDMDETWVRMVLGALLLRREKVLDLIGTLSVGEKGRVSLAKLLLSDANVLILDEPTNHLDIDACEAVEEALLNYPGTILFVSHDRRLMERLSDEVIEVGESRVRQYTGGYAGYLATRKKAGG